MSLEPNFAKGFAKGLTTGFTSGFATGYRLSRSLHYGRLRARRELIFFGLALSDTVELNVEMVV